MPFLRECNAFVRVSLKKVAAGSRGRGGGRSQGGLGETIGLGGSFGGGCPKIVV